MKREFRASVKCGKVVESISEVQKDPEFIKEINKFIKATTTVHNLS
ncbi:MAG: hypothetical protein ABIJ21_03135 [Nanoarchaeota archaeon]